MIRNINNCTIQSLGPIKQGELELGDLTLLVGPQATGKSIFLQTFKLLLDGGNIIRTLDQHGFSWQENWENFLALYFGEGMENLWQDNSRLTINGQQIELSQKLQGLAKKELTQKRVPGIAERVFLIPAQRVISLNNGWFRPFTEYDSSVPYVLKNFSEKLRRFMDDQFRQIREEPLIFPSPKHLENSLNETLKQRIFNQATIKVDDSKLRKRIILQLGEKQLPFMVWSTGQREFFPLLLSVYRLLEEPNNQHWVLIEEPEMGLHPKAIVAVILVIFNLLKKGKKVIISTHSPQVLDVVWAIVEMQKVQAAPKHLAKLFDTPNFDDADRRWILDLCRTTLKKIVRTYYFSKEAEGVYIRDISTLDPGDPQIDVAGWGGLTEFSSHVGHAVADAVQSRR